MFKIKISDFNSLRILRHTPIYCMMNHLKKLLRSIFKYDNTD
jgi:hypothetical protein